MPRSRQRLPFARSFTQEEVDRISLGLVPQRMQDKWFIFLEDDHLFFHRSWTGHCMHQLRLETREQAYAVAEAWVNREPAQYRNTDDEYDVALLRFLTDGLLLGQDRSFPLPRGLPKHLPEGVYQHHVTGTAYPEIMMPPRDSLANSVKPLLKECIMAHIQFLRTISVLPVADIQEAVDWYRQALGFEAAYLHEGEHPGKATNYAILRREGLEVHLILDEGEADCASWSKDGSGYLYLKVRGVDAVFSEVKGRGAQIARGLQTENWGAGGFNPRDPSGNAIHVEEET